MNFTDFANGTPAAAGNGHEGKYILFDLDGEDYCLPILKTQEVIAEYELTHLPNLPQAFRGVLSLRGEPVPVLDLRRKFSLPPRKRDADTRVIIVDTEDDAMGIEVDRVKRVINLVENHVERAPDFSGAKNQSPVSGVYEVNNGRFAIILNLEALLQGVDSEVIQAVRQEIARRQSVVPPRSSEAPAGL